MRGSATILKVLHHFCRMSPGWEKTWNFQHKSTFVNLILEKIAKGAWFRIKKLSYFRLENYKLYAPCGGMSNQIVENSVENVKFHRENRLCSRTFELSPPGFQHVEKVIGPLRIVYHIFVENFSHRQNRGRLCSSRVKMHLCGKTFLQKGVRPAKAENAADREQGVKTFAGQGQKMVIYWQTKAAYVCLLYTSPSPRDCS